MSEVYDEDHPDVIKAKAEGRARVLEARAKLHPIAQAIYALLDSAESLISSIGCLIILLVIVLGGIALFVPGAMEFFRSLFGR